MGYLALALLLGLWTAGLTLQACEGELIAPLDDTYIYLQYAQAAARGHPLEYQPDAEPTRGATSLLYPLLLAPAARVMQRDTLLWAAWLWGMLCLAGSALAVDRWATRRLAPAAGAASGLLTLLSGHYLWGAASGMDVVLYGAALAATVAAVAWYEDAPDERSGRRQLAGLFLALLMLGLARPEGLLPAFLVAGLVPLARRGPHGARIRWILILAPLTAAGVHFGVTLMALGEPVANTLAAKAVWTEQRPDVRAAFIARLPAVLGRITRVLFSDFRSPAYGHGSALLLEALLWIGAAVGLVTGLRGRRWGTAGIALVVVLFSGLLTGLIPAAYSSHHYRYQIPYVPLALLLVTAGWWRLVGARRSVALRAVPFVLIAALLLPGLVRFASVTAANASNIRDHQVATGRWIAANLPPGSIVALNDAGAIAYYGGRPVVDLVGLVTNGPTLPHRAGNGALFEWLQSRPLAERPTHFAIFPDWYPYLRHTTLVGRKLTQFTLGRNTISGADLKAVYVADWSHVEPEAQIVNRRELLDLWDFRVMDALDVADLASQDLHRWEPGDSWTDTLREFPFESNPARSAIDGGRLVSGGERFTLRCRPGAPAALVMRTEAFRDFRLRVRVNGTELGTWEVERRPLVWSEPLFEIPDSVLTGDEARIELRPAGVDDPPYPVYQYWLLQ